jgi:hypothetical protein
MYCMMYIILIPISSLLYFVTIEGDVPNVIDQGIEIDNLAFYQKLQSKTDFSKLTFSEQKAYISVPKMWSLHEGSFKYLYVIPSSIINGEFTNRQLFGSFLEVSPRGITFCLTCDSRTCSCVFVGLRDQTSGIASADSNSVLSLLTDENIDVDNSGNEFNLRK